MKGNSTDQPPTELDLSVQHLRAELVRIDVLIQHEVLRWQLAGQDPMDAFRGLHVVDAEAGMLLQRPFATSWGQMVALKPEDRQAFAQALDQADGQAMALSKEVRRRGRLPRLEHLAAAFDLDRFDLDTLLICLAPALDLRYERLYSFLQDDVTRKRPRINLVLDLLCEPGPERLEMLSRFADDAPLFKYHLLERAAESNGSPLLNQALSVDKAVVAWLLGEYQPRRELGSHVVLEPSSQAATPSLLATEIQAELDGLLGTERPPVVVFYGADESSQRAAARRLAAQVGHSLLAVDLVAIIAEEVAPLQTLRLALRDARLSRAVPYLFGWDACVTEGGTPSAALLAELCAYPGLVIVAGQKAWQAGGLARERRLVWLEFPVPLYTQRLALWQHFLDRETWTASDEPAPRTTPEIVDLPSLAGQFALTSGQIRDAVASARDMAAQHGDELQIQHLFAAARAHSNPRLGKLARKIVPRYDWSDIILPDDQLALLREIVATVRGRSLVLEEWGVGKKLASSAGVPILFSGPPGTGKTMAAEIIASELGLDLYKIDLSGVVSKYIGETEKNLERVFDEAQSSNAILFFDEADAIFGKRSEVKDAHDRYANLEISYLLQRMEAYDGVTILATNLRANLDEAFTRRLQFAVDFPFPDRQYRRRIWETLFPESVPSEPDLDFDLLARRFRLAGGNIRNIIISAAYLAAADGRRVSMQHLFHGTRRELQKMGRLVNEQDLALDERSNRKV